MSKIRKAAKGQNCTLRIHPGCGNPETVVFAHIGRRRGMGLKCNDLHGVFACYDCHTLMESDRNGWSEDKLRALEETQLKLLDMGLICLK